VVLFPSIMNVNELHQIEKQNLYIEINEESHCKEADKIRTNTIISSSGAQIIMFDITDLFDQDGMQLNANIITNLCKILIKDTKHKNNVMKLYLVEIEKLEAQFVNFIIDYKYNNKKFPISSIFSIMENNNDEQINCEKIIKILFKRQFFHNSDYYENPTDYNMILNNDTDYIVENYNKIILTRLGIESLFYSVDKKYWKNKDEFTKFKIELEDKYLVSVENLLVDDMMDILIEENNMKNSVFYILKTFDIDKYNNIKLFSKYKSLYHDEIPYVIKSPKHSIDVRILKLLISDDMYKKYEKTNKFKKDCFAGWRILYESEIKEIYNYSFCE
jgi:hypothetical protein